MKNSLTFLIGIAVFVILVVYMFTFQVRYDEVAVRTTFGKAQEPTRDEQTGEIIDAGDLITEPGLKFKAPWPIQKVYTYSNQVHILQDRLEQVTTSDGATVVVRLYVAWRIDDPYAFFRSLNNVENAQSKLHPMLRQLMGVISQYSFDQFVNTDPAQIRLREIEERCVEQLRRQLAGIQPSYGIRVEQVGINRVILPAASTEKVFERMRKTRERMAEAARAEGRAQASTIESDAAGARDRILAFAERRAQAIRAEGDLEAARYYEQFKENQDFAIFIDQMNALQGMLSHNTTFILDANKLWFLAPFVQPQSGLTPPPAEGAGFTGPRN